METIEGVDSNTCEVHGSVRNGTDHRILDAIFLTAFNVNGTPVASALVETFPVGFRSHDTLAPGEAGAILATLRTQDNHPLRSCAGIMRVELEDAIFVE